MSIRVEFNDAEVVFHLPLRPLPKDVAEAAAVAGIQEISLYEGQLTVGHGRRIRFTYADALRSAGIPTQLKEDINFNNKLA